jgi:nucleoside-diphosphate-sugar epimerase
MAKQFCRRDPELKIFGLRFSNIMEPEDYPAFASFQDDGKKRKWNLWGYIDARDAAQAVRLAFESNLKGAEVFIIANADTVMTASNDQLLSREFPEVPRKRAFAVNETLLSIEKARRVLGYAPRFSWRDQKG